MIDSKLLGKICKRYRLLWGKTQLDVAMDTGFSKSNVSAFETGRNDNCIILLWYFEHGLTYAHIERGLKWYGKKA